MRFFSAYFLEGQDIGDRETLLNLAVKLALPVDELDHALETAKYRPVVVSQGREAKELGIKAIPAFLFNDGQERIIGAQSIEVFRKKLKGLV